MRKSSGADKGFVGNDAHCNGVLTLHPKDAEALMASLKRDTLAQLQASEAVGSDQTENPVNGYQRTYRPAANSNIFNVGLTTDAFREYRFLTHI